MSIILLTYVFYKSPYSITYFHYFLIYRYPASLFPSNSLWHCFSISSFIKWYTDVNIGCFDVADISAILTNPQLMCIHNVKHDWFSDSAVPHNTRHIALHDIVFRTS